MKRNIGCNVIDHVVSRRGFLGATAVAGVGSLMSPAMATQVEKKQKQVLQIYLQGGVSQFESWDPKPGTEHGGPFRSISTSVPDIRISELLPYTAQKMHLLSIVQSYMDVDLSVREANFFVLVNT